MGKAYRLGVSCDKSKRRHSLVKYQLKDGETLSQPLTFRISVL